MAFDPEALLRVLAEHRVRYVLIGGLAAVLHGLPMTTGDADICPDTSAENLRALAGALAALDARIRAPDAVDGLPFDRSPEFLSRVSILNLATRYGDFDISVQPAGTAGYADLERAATDYDLGEGLVVPVAALEDVIRSKRAANRPKDHEKLPMLEQLLEKIRSGSR